MVGLDTKGMETQKSKDLGFFHFLGRRWVLSFIKTYEVGNTPKVRKNFRCWRAKNLTVVP